MIQQKPDTALCTSAQAAEATESLKTDAVRQALIGSRFNAPQGRAGELSLHLNKRSLLAQADTRGDFIIGDFGVTEPKPWNRILRNLQGPPVSPRTLQIKD